MGSYGIKQIDKRRSSGGCLRGPLLLIIVIALGAGGYYYYKNYYEKGSKAPLISGKTESAESGKEIKDDKEMTDKTEVVDIDDNSTKSSDNEITSVQDLMGSTDKTESKKPTLSAAAQREVKELHDKAVKEFRNKDYVKTRNYCWAILEKGLTEGQPLWEETVNMLGKANIEILLTGIVVPEKEIYTIQMGDSLDKIAKKFNTTIDAVQQSNGLDPASPVIHPNNQFHIYKGDWSILVSKGRYRLYLYDGKKLFKVYNVAIGKQNRTPVGTFEIVEKVRNPDWVYRGKRYPFGSKENVLGTRWMRMRPTGNTNRLLRGYGIHGTWEPDSIGKQASNGCIRMVNTDVEELFKIIPKYKKINGSYVDVTITED